MITLSSSLLRQSVLGSLLIVCGIASVSKADEEPLKLRKNVQIGGVYGATAVIKSIDVEENILVLKANWPELRDAKLSLTAATRYKIREKDVGIGDVKIGDVLLDIRNRNVDGKGSEAYYFASSLTVESLNPLTLTIKGSRGGGGPAREQKPGETPTDSLIEDWQSDEIRGIGHYFPHRGWRDEATGKWKNSNTLILPNAEKMIFTRSISTTPLKISELSVGQSIFFDATVRPNKEMNGLTLWTIKEKTPNP